MDIWQRWVRRPQSLWLRKAIFQIHLWTGIGLGIYVVLISVSGSAIVFRNELYKSLWPGPKIVAISGPRLSKDALKDAIHREWPQYNIRFIWEAKHPNEATEVMIAKGDRANAKTTTRLLDPFTGRDLGPSKPISIGILAWLQDLHFNLLAGEMGKKVNGLLAIFVVIMSVTGLVIWWPGTGRVRRSLTIDFKANWKRLNWDLHSVVGLWMFAFVFIWGVTGVYVVFPEPFQRAVNQISPLELYKPLSQVEEPAATALIIRVADAPRRRPPPIKRSAGDIFLRWFYYLHFGNFGGWPIKALWTLLGFAPVFLFVTGALMWWNRVLSREARAGTAGGALPRPPWHDWKLSIPDHVAKGVLPAQHLEKMVAEGHIRSRAPLMPEQIQPSSIDLRLGHEAYRVRASFLASGASTIAGKLEQYRLHTIDLTRPAVLEKGCVYIVPLQEELALPAHISGKANPKSSTGRLDIFTRLITDEGRQFEMVPAGYRGRLYAEVVPRTFSVVVRQGDRLSQLRLFQGDYAPSDIMLRELESAESLVYLPDETRGEATIQNGLRLSIDLEGDSEIIGYRAKKHAPLVDLARVQHYDPEEFWDPIRRNESRSLILDPEDFYILASRERVRIPASYAAEMVPFDATIGEFRIHYAGFFDPGFGYGSGDINGTRAVLEVRSHEVPFIMEHGQIVASLVFEKLLEKPRLLYGEGIGSSYQRQGLKLSKHFKQV